MTKIKDKKKLKGCLVNYGSGKISQKWASKYLEINRPHGVLNLRRAETPNEVFIRKMRTEVWLGLAVELFEW
jgi:hypothetical protein